MPRGKFSVLRKQTRMMVYEVFQFMQKEAKDGLSYDLKAIKKRTAAATGVGECTVRRIVAEAKASETNALAAMFKTPGKKRSGKRKITGMDNFTHGVIKRCIHNFYTTEKELPTMKSILKKFKEININFEGSMSSLSRILRELGFKWTKTGDGRKVLIEHSDIRFKRIAFLEKLAKYRAEGRPIVYTDETVLDTPQLKAKGQKLIIIHAGGESGFVPNALLALRAGLKPGEFQLTYENYKNWITTQLIPNLAPNSVVVMDNEGYHNKIEDAAPTSTAKRSELEAWLSQRNIPFSATMLKPQLYRLVSLNKDRAVKYELDRILREAGHILLRLPPCHPDLNPIEMTFKSLVEYTADKQANMINELVSLVNEKFNSLGADECGSLCRQVRQIEEEYKMNDVAIDSFTEELTIDGSDNERDSESEKESDTDDEASSPDEDPSTSFKIYLKKC